MSTKRNFAPFIMAILGGLIALVVYTIFFDSHKTVYVTQPYHPVQLANYQAQQPVDFTVAAEQTVHAVVHVRTKGQSEKSYNNPLYDFFYGEYPNSKPEPVMGFGSGVIIRADGYIVTNNHVIKDAEEISVKMNDNREFTAKLVGTDPSTDIAVLKIEANNLQYIEWGNSEKLKLGEWVLAVGNPYNLTSTVTAGIVSAKARNLNILEDQYRIESFIQTDAALNPGNSGGALVDINGKLVGINTAIISESGGYSGNSFAVPVTIVKKVVDDIIEFGTVQRAILGVSITDVNADIAKKNDLSLVKGVYVNGVKENGAAKEAGIKEGDVIVKINETDVNSSSELQEQISKFRPNTKIRVSIIREGKTRDIDVMLKNMYGDTGIVKANEGFLIMGAKLNEVSAAEKTRLGIKEGVKIVELSAGKFMKAGVEEGFIITRINNRPVSSISDVQSIINNTKGGVYLEGIYPNGVIAYYAFGM